MKLNTLAVHAGDRKKLGNYVPVTTPIYSATSFFYDSLEDLDRVFADEEPGENYSRYGNPTARAFEAQVAALEGGEVAFSTSSGMAALHFTTSTAEGGKVAGLEDCIVHPDHRRRGIGKALLAYVLEQARAEGALRVMLLTDGDITRAQALYRQLGFAPSSMLAMRLKLR